MSNPPSEEEVLTLRAEVARLRAEAARAEEQLHLALDSGRLGVWQFDVQSGLVTWSATLEKLHGIPVGSFGGLCL